MEDEDALVLLGKEFGQPPHTLEDWPRTWLIRSQTVTGSLRRAEKKHKEQQQKSKSKK